MSTWRPIDDVVPNVWEDEPVKAYEHTTVPTAEAYFSQHLDGIVRVVVPSRDGSVTVRIDSSWFTALGEEALRLSNLVGRRVSILPAVGSKRGRRRIASVKPID